MLAAFGVRGKRFKALNEHVFGRIPDEIEVLLIPISRWTIMRTVLPAALRIKWQFAPICGCCRPFSNRRRHDAMPWEPDDRHRPRPGRIDRNLVRGVVAVFSRELRHVARWGQEPGKPGARACDLRKLVGEADANALLSGHGAAGGHLASLGPLVGLEQLARGEIDRATYARQFGHRGPHELEVSIARPGEDSDWIDLQLQGLRRSPVDVATLLDRQESARAAAWERFRQRYPRRAPSLRRRSKGCPRRPAIEKPRDRRWCAFSGSCAIRPASRGAHRSR